MNANSEQLDFLGNVTLDQDQPLSPRQLRNKTISYLGAANCYEAIIAGKKVLVYHTAHKDYVLLLKAITYLGNPHPIFKKRIQLPSWYQYFCDVVKTHNMPYDVRFMGVYHYEGTIFFVDFLKDTYLQRGIHNSSAHVYINDLFQAQTYGIFRKEDYNGNSIVGMRADKLSSYLQDEPEVEMDSLFDLFRQFNCGLKFGEWIQALDAIQEMYRNEWRQWRQAEWAGWFLEYKFNKFTIDSNCTNKMRYISQKREGELDFDIRFEEADFYGDLKASDIAHKETPGNDQKSLIECIYRYNRFWYVIYEHETIKDNTTNYSATIARNRYIKSIDPSYENDELSYGEKMKNSVRFVKMTILELNKVNFRGALKNFAQGHQPDGSPRKPKFNIDKKVLRNDNYAVFRYTYTA